MDSEEMTEWMAFYTLEPFGPVRADWRAGMIASVLANVNRGKNTSPFKPDDFMPDFDGTRTREQSWQEQLAHARAITEACKRRP